MTNFIYCTDYCICLPICRNKTCLHAIEDCAIIQDKIKKAAHTFKRDYCQLTHFSFSRADFILYRDGNTVRVGVKRSNTGDTYFILTLLL